MPMSKDFTRRLSPLLPALRAEFGTPFHIYDAKGIRETGNRLKAAFDGIRFREYFAVKALPNPAILDITFNQLGFGFDASSIPEVKLARDLGATASDIMFTSNNTSDDEFAYALGGGGCILNLDDVSLIDRVPDPFPSLICFRYNPGKRRTGNSIIGNPVDAKYGITHDQVLKAYAKARRRGATRFGLHTMVASNSRKGSYMVETVRMLLELAALLKEKQGIELEFINMGGGFGIPYRPNDAELPLEWTAKRIIALLRRFEKEHGYMPKLLTECGRYITGPHGALVSSVINRKDIYRRYIGVDTGMPALMRPGIYSSAYHESTLFAPNGRERRGRLFRQSIVGSICENCDRLATGRLLPWARIGDFVVTHDTGAHGIAMGFNYNGRLRPQELLFEEDGSVRLIRRAEMMDDYFATLRGFEERVLAA